MFGSKTKVSSASSNGLAQSGLGAFSPKNKIALGGGGVLGFEFDNPLHVAGLGAILLAGWYAWRKIK